jgi:exopolysaccharide biosynthesis protein
VIFIKLRNFLVSTVALTIIAAIFYTCFVFSSIPLAVYWRTIWIETAMTTGSHKWLATSFIPADIIDGVMKNSAGNIDVIGGKDNLLEKPDTGSTGDIPEETATPESKPEGTDILGQGSLVVGQPDYAGNKISINDIGQGLVVSEITGSGYKGKIMLIDDPSRIFIGVTSTPDVEGLRIKDMLAKYDAIAGINASGFSDYSGNGNGGQVVGLSCSQDNIWGEYINYYGSVVLSENNRLVVGNISVWKNYNIRDGIQFGPVLIADGVAQVTGSAGYGLQPRTAIGQREDGVIVFLVIDGRDMTHSIGCTVGDMADILLKYDVINAASCDGGSSTVLAYDGNILNRNCSANPELGRRLPNAFLVKRK